MEQDLNGINSSDTILRLIKSTISKVKYLILLTTRIKKANTLELLTLRLTEFNKDGSLDMSTK
jgi:hypothetical protein